MQNVTASLTEIASVTAVNSIAVYVGLRGDVRQTTKRNCMTCGKQFQSHGFNNRMCTKCRKLGDDWTPYMPEYID